ncbi:hypothetical protein SASPL_156272 [Salvia splendens]|uniref:RING-type E3 ubiquitin transferase n=1 Tax=Salvia splendens TaxID=180675 RepID=A0A8X8VWX8_SALSN|nr:hypothetical protein SASPL_156272 [Salvia splendens]
MGSGKQRWKISFHKSPSPLKQQPPAEFLCPLSGNLMADPVIVASGHTFERSCVHACVSLSFHPTLTGAAADFSAIIPNLALKSTIVNWCLLHRLDPPKPLAFHSAEKIIRQLMPPPPPPPVEFNRTPSVGSSEESATPRSAPSRTPPPPLLLTTRPSCYSSSSSCDIEITSSSISLEEEELYSRKMKSSEIHEQEEALISLRKLTRTREESRACFCTPRILSSLKSLIISRYSNLQVNAAAVLVNLSLEKQNKVKIVRSGIVPPLIDLLRGGCIEAQDHAAGAIFSLSLDDQNKTAIGVLGALPPLLHALRSDSERTRHDSALALYHLLLVQSNRVKMIKLGAVQLLLGMVKSGHMSGRVMLVLCNLAASAEGGRQCWTAGRWSVSLSYGGLRFKGLAKECGAEEVVEGLEKRGKSEVAREKCRRILEVLREKHEEDEDMNWEELLGFNDDLTKYTVTGSSSS